MSDSVSNFELPKNINRYFASLSRFYAQEGKRLLQEILVNSQVRIHEARSIDNWNGGTYGHAIYLVLPEVLYIKAIKQKNEIENEIKQDINRISNVQNEFVEEIYLEMEVVEDSDWRKESGLQLSSKRVVLPDTVKRIWGDDGFRVFLSHKSEVNKETAELKQYLSLFGISCFVAHKDINPTIEWQDEIINALTTMDAFVALMTDGFHDSEWTDQEVGFALARGTSIIAIQLGKTPYGFIGKFQALSSIWSTVGEDLIKMLINDHRVYDAYIKAIKKCPNWDTGNTQAKALAGIKKLTQLQIDELITAYNQTFELHGSFGFNGTRSLYYGPGLVSHLNRLSTRRYKFNESGIIEEITPLSD